MRRAVDLFIRNLPLWISCAALGMVCWGPITEVIASTIGKPGGGAAFYQTVQDESVDLPQEARLNFLGGGVSCVDNAGLSTDCTITGLAASAYDQIQDEGVNLTQRTTLDFAGAGVACVDSGGTKTLCTIAGGGGGGEYIGATVTDPPAAGWTWENQTTKTVTANADGSLTFQMTSADTTGGIYYRAIGAATFSLTVGFSFNPDVLAGTKGSFIGLCLRDSTTARLVCFTIGNAASRLWSTNKRTDSNTFSADYVLVNAGRAAVMEEQTVWFRVVADATNYTWYYSFDGTGWLQYDQRAKTDFLAVAADQWGVWIKSGAGSRMVTTLWSAAVT